MSHWIKRVRRWLHDRCDLCGHGFAWSKDPRHSHGNRDGKVWHGPCISLVIIRGKAEERLEVVRLVCDIAELTKNDVLTVASLRKADDVDGSNYWNLVWRVLYDLEKQEKASA